MHFLFPEEFSYQEILTPQQLDMIANASGCLAHRRVPDCKDMCFHSKYRTFDGSCNNLQHPLWGSSYTAFRRVLRPVYENGFNLPIGILLQWFLPADGLLTFSFLSGWSRSVQHNGFSKPSARLVSTRVISTKEVTSDRVFTHMLMQWGQFVDHDLDFAVPGMSGESFGEFIDCST